MSKIFESTVRSSLMSKEGELLEERVETKIVRKVSPKDFIQVYLEDLSKLFNIGSPTEIKVLISLWKHTSFNKQGEALGNKVVLIKSIKASIAEDIGTSIGTIDNAISKLVKKDLLIKTDRSVYLLNPKYFFKGYIPDRINVIRTVIEYQIEKNSADQLELGDTNQ